MRDQIGLRDLQLVQHLRDVQRLRFLLVSTLRMRRETHSSQIGNDDGVILHKHRCHRRPHVAGVTEAVQHHYGRTVAADTDVDYGAVGRNFLHVEARRKRLDLGRRRCGERRECQRQCEFGDLCLHVRSAPIGRRPRSLPTEIKGQWPRALAARPQVNSGLAMGDAGAAVFHECRAA